MPATQTTGRASNPDMVLALLLYAANGMRSSRRTRPPAPMSPSRRSAGDSSPTTPASPLRSGSRGRHSELLVSVLRLCATTGLVDLSSVAIDGTKTGSNTSLWANHSVEWIRARVGELMAATVASEEAEAPVGPGCD